MTLRAIKLIIPGALCCLMAACVVPSYDPMLEQPVGANEKPQIVGAYGPLSARQSAALLADLRAGTNGADILRRHLIIEEAIADTPLVAGNKVRVLRDGEVTFRATFAAIRAAKDHVNLEYYILEDVESDGVFLGDLLVEKLGEGVAVNVIYDSYGSGETPAAFFDRLREAGARIVEFNPLNPLKAKAGYSINDRDHRKILVADGRLAIIGGVNLSRSYQSRSPGMSAREEEPPEPGAAARSHTQENQRPDVKSLDANADVDVPPQHWRDTDLEIEGPAVADLQRLFVQHWREQKGPAFDEAAFFPSQEP